MQPLEVAAAAAAQELMSQPSPHDSVKPPAAFELDPRWNKQQPGSPSGSTVKSRGVSRASSLLALNGEVSRQGSFGRSQSQDFRDKESSLSIVFNAEWVKISAPIGEGAFSRVYEGVYTNPDTSDQSVVAVKILKKNMLKRRSDCLRFIKEAKIMTKICHKNIVACYGIGKYDDEDPHHPGSLFIVQELVRGGNLLHRVYKQMLNRQKCVYTSVEALAWLVDVAQGMQYLHCISESKPMIIHRDLKLENIMLAPDINGTLAKLVDFGLHKVIDDRIKKVVKRVMSEATLGNRFLGSMARRQVHAEDDEEDELEVALAQQRAQQDAAALASAAQAASAGATAANGLGISPSSSMTSRFHPLRKVGGSGDSHNEADEGQEEPAVAGSSTGSGSSNKSPIMRANVILEEEPESETPTDTHSGASTAHSGASTSTQPEAVVPKVRAPPKKQSSMQKLVAKMKEVKMRVLGKHDSAPDKPSNLSKTSNEQPAPPPLSAADQELAEKKVRNEALLNRLIAQQSTAQAQQYQALDDLSLVGAGAVTEKKRPPPRRAITWVNEIRYNLTEAVGSWAYMAPEVVLGQPYNEKVDVFSFGVILFEVLNRKLMLVDEIKNDPRKDAQAYAERVAKGFRPEIPRKWPDQLRELIGSCWAQDPHMRPNFTAVVDVLRELQEQGSIAKLDLFYWSKGNAFI